MRESVHRGLTVEICIKLKILTKITTYIIDKTVTFFPCCHPVFQLKCLPAGGATIDSAVEIL